MKRMSRRTFSKTAAALTGLSALSAGRVLGANERVQLGFIGLGNRGDELLDAFLQNENAIPIALSDLNEDYIKFARAKAGGLLNFPKDYRELLDLKVVDAVVIATPDHWHALQTIEACKAGKDVYVEKPLSLCVAEGRAMVEAAKKSKRIVQVGLHRRSSTLCMDAIKEIRDGALGQITMCRAFHVQNEWPEGIGNPPDGRAPDKLNWDSWLGPAPMKSYNVNRTFYRFRWFYDYSGGQLTNFGAHYLDFFHWAMGQDTPRSVAALGGKFAIKDNREIPDTLEVVWQYPNNTLVTLTQVNANGGSPTPLSGAEIEIRGTRGTFYLSGNEYVIIPEVNMTMPFPAQTPLNRTLMKAYRDSGKGQRSGVRKKLAIQTRSHTDNFIKAVKSREQPNCPIETGHRSTTATLLGRIALQQHALLDWDGTAEQFTNSKEANALLRYEYRAPYKFPT